MNHQRLRDSIRGIATAVTAMMALAQPGSAQCVSGLGATSAQWASQDWSRRTEDITAFVIGSSKVTLQRPTQVTADTSGLVYVLDSGANMIFQTNGVIGVSGLPTAVTNVSPFQGSVTQTRFADGYFWALSSNGKLSTPFLQSKNYTNLQVSSNPLVDLTFDGQYLWVSDGSRNLYKVLPPALESPASLVGTVQASTSAFMGPLVFDGWHVWAASQNQLLELDTSTGKVLSAVVLGDNISSLMFDGFYFWLGEKTTGNLIKVNPQSQAVTYAVAAPNAKGLVFDGTLVWMPNSQTNSLATVRGCDGAINTLSLAAAPSGVAFDGKSVWIIYTNSASVSIR